MGEGFECFELGVLCITFSFHFLSDALFHCITVAIYFTSQQKTQQKDVKYKQMIYEPGLAKSLARRPGAIVFSSRLPKCITALPDGLP